ncbi:MAG: hypothetical protein IPK12_11105 [Gemmatimonadetes bacterium]|nr:hypothetical protein [Gemmatimonadota bacterium]
MPPSPPDVRRMLRDVGLVLGVPLLALAGLVTWGWQRFEGYDAEPARQPLAEVAARRDQVRDAYWYQLRILAPEGWVLAPNTTPFLVIEERPVSSSSWAARMAFLPLDSAAIARFDAAGAGCGLAEGRCWTERVGSHTVLCRRNSGQPDPDLDWTPHLECQVRDLTARIAINAPQGPTLELLDIFRAAVARTDSAPPTAP